MTLKYETVIGLEVHAQLKTASKIFCGCSTEFGAAPNEHVCPVCMGMPGVLPVLNEKVINLAVRAGLALNCRIADPTTFDRKNYFYADLPKGYQISQFSNPICQDGYLQIGDSRIRIQRAHLEEDAGKLVHSGADGLHGSNYSLVDLNRAGVPLLEIVTEPDIRSAEQARAYLEELRSILRYTDVCDGNMEEGSFRCDANVSLRKAGDPLGTKTEIKNMNSFKAVSRAIQSEIARQEYILSQGETIAQETRLWNEAEQKTFSMRSKEEAHDYRYFPEPDLVPVRIDSQLIEKIRAELPELPAARRSRYMLENGLSPEESAILSDSRPMSDFYDKAVNLGTPPKVAANILINWTVKYMNDNNVEFQALRFSPENLLDIAKAMETGQLGSTNAHKLLDRLLEKGGEVGHLINELGLAQLSDENEIEQLLLAVMERSEKQVEQYRQGKTKVRQYFFGEIMKETKGKGNPSVINSLLDRLLPGPAKE